MFEGPAFAFLLAIGLRALARVVAWISVGGFVRGDTIAFDTIVGLNTAGNVLFAIAFVDAARGMRGLVRIALLVGGALMFAQTASHLVDDWIAAAYGPNATDPPPDSLVAMAHLIDKWAWPLGLYAGTIALVVAAGRRQLVLGVAAVAFALVLSPLPVLDAPYHAMQEALGHQVVVVLSLLHGGILVIVAWFATRETPRLAPPRTPLDRLFVAVALVAVADMLWLYGLRGDGLRLVPEIVALVALSLASWRTARVLAPALALTAVASAVCSAWIVTAHFSSWQWVDTGIAIWSGDHGAVAMLLVAAAVWHRVRERRLAILALVAGVLAIASLAMPELAQRVCVLGVAIATTIAVAIGARLLAREPRRTTADVFT